MARILRLASNDTPNATVKRELHRRNFGLWCNNSDCKQFFAVAIEPKDAQQRLDIKFVSDGPVAFESPFCKTFQKRAASEIADIILTEALKRRPPPPKKCELRRPTQAYGWLTMTVL